MNIKIRTRTITIFYYILSIYILPIIHIIDKKNTVILFTVIVSAYIGLNLKKLIESDFINLYKNKYIIILIILVSMYFAFSLVGIHIFLTQGIVNITLMKVINFFMVFIWSIPLTFNLLYFFQRISEKNTIYDDTKITNIEANNIAKKCFFISLIGGILYICAYNPANMFADSVWQYRQIKENYIFPYDDWHPVFHTLLIKFIIHFIDTPVAISLIQVIIMSLIIALFFKELYMLGISRKLLYIINGFVILNIGYGTMISNIWKDTPYTIAILGLTLLIYWFIKANFKFTNKHYCLLIITLICVNFLRHNGKVVFMLSMLFLIIYTIKYKKEQIVKIIFTAIISTVLIFIIRIPIYKSLGVIEVRNGTMAIPPLHAIASVIKSGNDDKLSNETKELMYSILDKDTWIERYNPFHSDDLVEGFSDMTFYDNTDNIEMKRILSAYIDTFTKYPLQIIADRMCGAELLWNILPADGSYNYVVENNNSTEFESEFHIYRSNNVFTKIAKLNYMITEKISILNIFILRSGIWIYFELIVIIYGIINRKKITFILLPCVFNIISIGMSMSCQHMRYTWFVNIICIFAIGIVLFSNEEKLYEFYIENKI